MSTLSTPEEQDERRGLPSASGYARLKRCPGSLGLERWMPRDVDDSSEESRSGDRIHAKMAGEDVELTDDEERVVARFRRLEEQLLAQFQPEGGWQKIERETRMWLTDDEDHEMMSGKPDVIAWSYDVMLVIDFKSGWLGAEDAPENDQLRALAVIADRNSADHELKKVYVAIVGRTGEPIVAEYDKDTLDAAWLEMDEALCSATSIYAPLVPGPKQCKYCRAKSVCPALQSLTLPAEAGGKVPLAAINATPEQMTAMLEVCDVADIRIEAIRKEAKRRLAENPNSIPGYRLKPGAAPEKIVNVQGVFERCLEHGVTAEKFAARTSITKKNLSALLKDATGAKGKGLDAICEAVTAGYTESKQSAPSLERYTPAPALEEAQ